MHGRAKRDRRVADMPANDLRCLFGVLSDRRIRDRRTINPEGRHHGESQRPQEAQGNR